MATAKLIAFTSSYFFIAASPGLCMTLSLSLGIALGVRRSLPMMAGELTGIALVAAASLLGVSALLLGSPTVFAVFKVAGAAYLFWMAWRAWQASAVTVTAPAQASPSSLWIQGFATAVSNPKAWAFNMALFPPFIDTASPLPPQMATLVAVMVLVEFGCLLLYAYGGRALSEILIRRGKAQWLNRAAAVMMALVAGWLLLG